MAILQMVNVFDFATDLALQTGSLLKSFYQPIGIQAAAKADHTVVTQADLAADRFIIQEISKKFPQDNILTEESSHIIENPLCPTWIIDPLDGTTNFSLGLSIWGVSIARMENGYPDLGILYFPVIDELYRARRGHGAWLNNLTITTRAPDPAQPMSFFACCSRTFRNYNINIPYKPRIMGSGAYTFCMLARGCALLGFDAEPKIWDLAAAWLLVEEAGGTISAFGGSSPFPISRFDDYSNSSYPTLAAATPDVYTYAQRRITRKSETKPEILSGR
jgi:myo-inositol-1(or 4)-monophosphatase